MPKLMTGPGEEVDLPLLEQSVAELALPAHMMWLMSRSVLAQGYVMRRDIEHHLNVAAASPLSALPAESTARVAKRVDDLGRRLLYELSPDLPVHGLYCCAMFCLKLVDEGMLHDPQHVAVLAAMLLIDDLKLEGGTDGYALREPLLKQEADKVLARARLEGLYRRQVQPKVSVPLLSSG